MNKDARYLEILQHRQPFVSSNVSDPKDHIFPDVPSINEKVYHCVIDLIRMKSQNPSVPIAALILGEAGYGKTHLINRLIRTVDSHHDLTYRVAYIQPIEDPAQTYSYLLREIVTNLFYPIKNNYPPTIMHGILAELIKEVLIKSTFSDPMLKEKVHKILQNNPVDIFYELDPKMSLWLNVEKKLKKMYSNVCPPVFFQILMQLRFNDRLFAIIEWLKCNTLDADMAKMLRIKPDHLSSISATEQASRDMIKTLSTLIGICNHPLLVCFDRLENLDSNDKVQSFGRMVEFLVDDARAMMPVAFCRGDLWNNILKHKFNTHVSERLESNTFELLGCDVNQALELIASRLTWAYGNSNHNFQPFDRNMLEEIFSNRLRNTRYIIQKANKLLRHLIMPIEIKPVSTQLKSNFCAYFQKVLDEFDRYAPERSRFRRALRLFFEIKDFSVDIQFGDKYIDFGFSQNIQTAKKGIVIIDVENHHRAVGASIKRGIDFLDKNPQACALYFRDERSLLPSRWLSTNAALAQFKSKGGHVLILDRNEAAQCFAITLMHYAIKEGDVSVETQDIDMRNASIDEFLHFLYENILHEPFTLFKKMADILNLRKKIGKKGKVDPTPTPKPKPKNQTILNKTIECLRPQPMMMASTDNILAYLSDNDIQTNIDNLMRLIQRFNDRFVIHRSKTETIIMIKKEWMNAQP